MPLFTVSVTRRFESRHVHTRVVEAPDGDAAVAWVSKELEADEFDPSDDYTEQASGYDDCSGWEVSDEWITAIAGPADTEVGNGEDSEAEEAGQGYTNQG